MIRGAPGLLSVESGLGFFGNCWQLAALAKRL
jgi:hypothetical protein